MQIKTMMKYHFTAIVIAVSDIKKSKYQVLVRFWEKENLSILFMEIEILINIKKSHIEIPQSKNKSITRLRYLLAGNLSKANNHHL